MSLLSPVTRGRLMYCSINWRVVFTAAEASGCLERFVISVLQGESFCLLVLRHLQGRSCEDHPLSSCPEKALTHPVDGAAGAPGAEERGLRLCRGGYRSSKGGRFSKNRKEDTEALGFCSFEVPGG